MQHITMALVMTRIRSHITSDHDAPGDDVHELAQHIYIVDGLAPTWISPCLPSFKELGMLEVETGRLPQAAV
jgi:hypothetical protein